MSRTALLWAAAVVLGAGGTALVFAAVTAAGLFVPGVVLIIAGALAAAAAGVLETIRPGA